MILPEIIKLYDQSGRELKTLYDNAGHVIWQGVIPPGTIIWNGPGALPMDKPVDTDLYLTVAGITIGFWMFSGKPTNIVPSAYVTGSATDGAYSYPVLSISNKMPTNKTVSCSLQGTLLTIVFSGNGTATFTTDSDNPEMDFNSVTITAS